MSLYKQGRRGFLGLAVLGLLSFSANAAQVSPSPTGGSGGVGTAPTGSAQTIFPNNFARQNCVIENKPASVNNMYITWDGTNPSSTYGVTLRPGDIFYCNRGVTVLTGAIKLLGTGTDAYWAEEIVATGS